MISMLRDIKKVFDGHQVEYWLEYGSLLGAVREGKMIEGDHDIDLSMFYHPLLENYEAISKELYDRGYDVYITQDKMTVASGEKRISIYLYHENKEHITRSRTSKKNYLANILLYGFLEGLSTPGRDRIHGFNPKTKLVSIMKNLLMYLPSKTKIYPLLVSCGERIDCMVVYQVNIPHVYVDGFKWMTFHGIDVRIPGRAEQYLAHIYGKNWMVPDTDWHPWKSFYTLMAAYNVKIDLLSKLKRVVELLRENNIHFWMYGGALLGYIRDGDLIPWDKDIDLFVWEEEYPRLFRLKNSFRDIGFKFLIREKNIVLAWEDKNIAIMYYGLYDDQAVREKLVTKNKLGNMIYFGLLVKTVEYHWRTLYLLLRWVLLKTRCCYLARQVVPSHFYLNLKEIDFFGISLKVPAETEDYLAYTFGETWRTPIKDFRYNPEYFRVVG